MLWRERVWTARSLQGSKQRLTLPSPEGTAMAPWVGGQRGPWREPRDPQLLRRGGTGGPAARRGEGAMAESGTRGKGDSSLPGAVSPSHKAKAQPKA